MHLNGEIFSHGQSQDCNIYSALRSIPARALTASSRAARPSAGASKVCHISEVFLSGSLPSRMAGRARGRMLRKQRSFGKVSRGCKAGAEQRNYFGIVASATSQSSKGKLGIAWNGRQVGRGGRRGKQQRRQHTAGNRQLWFLSQSNNGNGALTNSLPIRSAHRRRRRRRVWMGVWVCVGGCVGAWVGVPRASPRLAAPHPAAQPPALRGGQRGTASQRTTRRRRVSLPRTNTSIARPTATPLAWPACEVRAWFCSSDETPRLRGRWQPRRCSFARA